MRAMLRRLGDLSERAFWLLPATMVAVGVAAGFLIPLLDTSVGFNFVDHPESARTILATIATVTVSVAGVSFSIVVVALVLAGQQLSPRVMRTFRSRPLNQVVLGAFIGTFAYALLVLRTVGNGPGATYVPHVAVSIAMLLAVVASALFIAFIGAIVYALEASTVIRRIAAEGHAALERPYPAHAGSPAENPDASSRQLEQRMRTGAVDVRSIGAGFVRTIDAQAIVDLATEADALVAQEVLIGDFALTDTLLARVWCEASRSEEVAQRVRDSVELGPERTPLHDIRFPIRQLADVALRGVSPSINDPTTAENAMDSLADTLGRIARQERPVRIRTDARGVERFVARGPDLAGLVRLGFAEVRVKSGDYPVLCVRLLELLQAVNAAAPEGCGECRHQARLVLEGVRAAGLTSDDVAMVSEAHDRLFAPVAAG